MSRRAEGRLSDVFVLSEGEFEHVGLKGVFRAIQNAEDSLQQLPERQHDKLAFFCRPAQRTYLAKIGGHWKYRPSVVSYAFPRCSCARGIRKRITSSAAAPFGSDDVFLCDYQRLLKKYRRILGQNESGVRIEIPSKVLRRADVWKYSRGSVGPDAVFTCMLAFARYTYPDEDIGGFIKQQREKVDDLRTVVERNAGYSGGDLERMLYDSRMRKSFAAMDVI